MAIIRNAANTLKKGRVGETTYYISKGQQVARQSRNDSNYGETARRTESQQNRRVLWANLVQFYKISARWMPKAFESRKPGQTDYNKFMAVNVPTARIPLTKTQAEAGGCVVDGFLVSQGSLPSIEVEQTVDGWVTNLFIGQLVIGNDTTVAELTSALVSNNGNVREGMQLSFVQYLQQVDPLGIPRANCRCYEVTLSTTSTNKVRDYMPAVACSSVDGKIGTSGTVGEGGFAWILTELQGGSLKVSTQLLTVNNMSLILQYMMPQQLQEAVQSYGLDSEVVLNPSGTVTQSAEPISAYIAMVSVGNNDYRPGNYFGTAGQLYGTQAIIRFSEEIADMVTQVYLFGTSDGNEISVNGFGIVKNNDQISASFGTSQGSVLVVTKFSVFLDNGQVLNIEFSTTNPGDMG